MHLGVEISPRVLGARQAPNQSIYFIFALNSC